MTLHFTDYNTSSFAPSRALPPAPPSFVRGTEFSTMRGQVTVENLMPGDEVRNRTNGVSVVRKVSQNPSQRLILKSNPMLRPLVVAAGSLGPGCPADDVYLSPDWASVKRIAMRSMHNLYELQVVREELLKIKGVSIHEQALGIDYYRLLFDGFFDLATRGMPSINLLNGSDILERLPLGASSVFSAVFPEAYRYSPSQ